MVDLSPGFVARLVLGVLALFVVAEGARGNWEPSSPGAPRTVASFEGAGFIRPLDSLDEDRSVDLRHAPPRWKTLISFPDDRRKSLVNENGALTYDFGPGPYAQPTTTVRVGVQGDTLRRIDQQLLGPRVPVVVTKHRSTDVRVRQEAFALVLDSARIPPPPPDTARVHRRNGRTRTLGWASPKGPADPAFRNVAWGSNRPVRYVVDVDPGSRKRIALGFCDSYRKQGRVRRLMELRVEGAETKTINVVEEGGQNVPQVVLFDAVDADGDGELTVEVGASTRTADPNVFVNVLWMFEAETSVEEQALVRGEATAQAEVYLDCGREPARRRLPPRVDAVRAEFEGPSVTPTVRIQSRRPFAFDEATGVLRAHGRPFVVTRPRATDAQRTDNGWTLELPSGTETADVLVVRGHRLPDGMITDVPDLREARAKAAAYWRGLDLPWDRIQLPDAEMQAFLEASIRTVYQLREPVDGVPQFQPGATVYRGLWAAHLPRVGRAAAALGDTAAARRSLEQLLDHQEADGQIVVLTPPTLLKETGTALKAVYHQSRLSGGKEWLANHWSHVEKAVGWIRSAREQAPNDPTAPNYGLMPAALSDGGVGGIVPEYTTVHWSLIGLRSAVEAARWLGKTEQALEWQAAYADFWAAYRKGVARDARRDEHGNLFLPIRMNYDPETHVPQRSQVNMCHMMYPGRLYARDDPLVEGTLGILRDAESAQGLPVSIGWLDGGVWAEVGFTCAQAYLWNGDVEHAQDLLYAAANHAAPTRIWVEEQMPGGSANRTGGDVPHGNASAEFINLVRTLLVMEGDTTLNLLRGLPTSWIEPGAELRVDSMNTTFGPLTMTLTVSDDGQQGRLAVAPVGQAGDEGGPVVHLRALKEAEYVRANGEPLPERWAGTWGKQMQIQFRRAPQ
ncbi:MAG: hypothetical protein ABEL51_03940 [Salinibacter sp.]